MQTLIMTWDCDDNVMMHFQANEHLRLLEGRRQTRDHGHAHTMISEEHSHAQTMIRGLPASEL